MKTSLLCYRSILIAAVCGGLCIVACDEESSSRLQGNLSGQNTGSAGACDNDAAVQAAQAQVDAAEAALATAQDELAQTRPPGYGELAVLAAREAVAEAKKALSDARWALLEARAQPPCREEITCQHRVDRAWDVYNYWAEKAGIAEARRDIYQDWVNTDHPAAPSTQAMQGYNAAAAAAAAMKAYAEGMVDAAIRACASAGEASGSGGDCENHPTVVAQQHLVAATKIVQDQAQLVYDNTEAARARGNASIDDVRVAKLALLEAQEAWLNAQWALEVARAAACDRDVSCDWKIWYGNALVTIAISRHAEMSERLESHQNSNITHPDNTFPPEFIAQLQADVDAAALALGDAQALQASLASECASPP